MSANPSAPRLFAIQDEPSKAMPPIDFEFRKTTGILPSQAISAMIEAGHIGSLVEITPDQVQPASMDLRLGSRAYRVQASFLPGTAATVMTRVQQLDGLPAIDIAQGAVLEKGCVYVIELLESLKLPTGMEATANPKSSTGRLDILTRLITDRGAAFDRVAKGYNGPLFVEVAPLSFSVIVRQGTKLNQLRFHRGSPEVPAVDIAKLYAEGQLSKAPWGIPLPLLRGQFVPVSVDLGIDEARIVGYRAKKNSKKIDLDLIAHYDPTEFWEPIYSEGGTLNLDRDDFYILATREEIGVPPHLAAEMMPFDSSSGEFRVHYAGFFDPGFGWDGKAGGSKAVLEVRSYGVAFTLEHGQVVGWLNYSEIGTGTPDRIYGKEIKSNYQGQGLMLAKQFKPWPRPRRVRASGKGRVSPA
jgi:dCTP deaminase